MENQRIRLSKTMLKNALLQLLKEKPLDQITILELCKKAQINRTTFYKYYGSQADVLREIEADFFARLDENMKNVLDKEPDTFLLVLDYLYEQRETFRILVRAIPTKDFTERLYAIPSVGMFFQNMVNASNYSETESRYIRCFVLQGAFAVLCDWLESEAPEPSAVIAEVFGQLRDKLG